MHVLKLQNKREFRQIKSQDIGKQTNYFLHICIEIKS